MKVSGIIIFFFDIFIKKFNFNNIFVYILILA